MGTTTNAIVAFPGRHGSLDGCRPVCMCIEVSQNVHYLHQGQYVTLHWQVLLYLHHHSQHITHQRAAKGKEEEK